MPEEAIAAAVALARRQPELALVLDRQVCGDAWLVPRARGQCLRMSGFGCGVAWTGASERIRPLGPACCFT